jgi:hypothetical protein
MGDVKKDIESLRRINATPQDKLNIMCDLNDFVVASFEERIRRKNPHITKDALIALLRVELSHGRRDSY